MDDEKGNTLDFLDLSDVSNDGTAVNLWIDTFSIIAELSEDLKQQKESNIAQIMLDNLIGKLVDIIAQEELLLLSAATRIILDRESASDRIARGFWVAQIADARKRNEIHLIFGSFLELLASAKKSVDTITSVSSPFSKSILSKKLDELLDVIKALCRQYLATAYPVLLVLAAIKLDKNWLYIFDEIIPRIRELYYEFTSRLHKKNTIDEFRSFMLQVFDRSGWLNYRTWLKDMPSKSVQHMETDGSDIKTRTHSSYLETFLSRTIAIITSDDDTAMHNLENVPLIILRNLFTNPQFSATFESLSEVDDDYSDDDYYFDGSGVDEFGSELGSTTSADADQPARHDIAISMYEDRTRRSSYTIKNYVRISHSVEQDVEPYSIKKQSGRVQISEKTIGTSGVYTFDDVKLLSDSIDPIQVQIAREISTNTSPPLLLYSYAVAHSEAVNFDFVLETVIVRYSTMASGKLTVSFLDVYNDKLFDLGRVEDSTIPFTDAAQVHSTEWLVGSVKERQRAQIDIVEFGVDKLKKITLVPNSVGAYRKLRNHIDLFRATRNTTHPSRPVYKSHLLSIFQYVDTSSSQIVFVLCDLAPHTYSHTEDEKRESTDSHSIVHSLDSLSAYYHSNSSFYEDGASWPSLVRVIDKLVRPLPAVSHIFVIDINYDPRSSDDTKYALRFGSNVKSATSSYASYYNKKKCTKGTTR